LHPYFEGVDGVLISEKYRELTKVETVKRKFPADVKVETKWFDTQFRVVFTESSGQEFSTDWLWNHKYWNERNQLVIDAKLKRVEKYLVQELDRNIELSLRESRIQSMRKQHIESKINRLFEGY
jgi:hypothetical protein